MGALSGRSQGLCCVVGCSVFKSSSYGGARIAGTCSHDIVTEVGAVLPGGRPGEVGVDGSPVVHRAGREDGPERVETDRVRPHLLHGLDTGATAVIVGGHGPPVVVVGLEEEPRVGPLGVTVLQAPNVGGGGGVVSHHSTLPGRNAGHDEVPRGDHRLADQPLDTVLKRPGALAHSARQEGEDPVAALRRGDGGGEVGLHGTPRVDGDGEAPRHQAGTPHAHSPREGGALVDHLPALRHDSVVLQRREGGGVVLVAPVEHCPVGVLGDDGGARARAHTLPLLGQCGHGGVGRDLVKHVRE
eukprot:Hpha_TRINITY_DN16889_c4_g2::TRINITY_DN16889_c4_g2_i2::g.148297::m.148297